MDDIKMQMVWSKFRSDLEALWGMVDKLSPVADREDEHEIRILAEKLAYILEEDASGTEKYLQDYISQFAGNEIEPCVEDYPDLQNDLSILKDVNFLTDIKKWGELHPQKFHKFVEVFKAIFAPPAKNGVTFRRSAYISLVTILENLLTSLLVVGTQAQIGIWGYRKKIQQLENSGLDLSNYPVETDLINKINRRRNLFVHKDGIIDQEFLVHETGMVKYENRRFQVNTPYLMESIQNVYLFGFLVFELCWDKWGGSRKIIDQLLVDALYSLLVKEKYDFAIRLAEHEGSRITDLNYFQMAIINQAIAYRDSGRVSEVQKAISQIKKPASDHIRLGRLILQKKYTEAYRLSIKLKQTQKSEYLPNWDWPLFRPVRSQARWKVLMEE